jgi:glycolate oxidase
VVVLPENEAQVQALMRLYRSLNVPIVARGAGTGLSGRAMPYPEGVLLGLSKLNRIKKIDLESATAIVEPGYAIWLFPRRRRPMGCITRLIHPAR